MPYATAAEDRVRVSQKWPWKPRQLPALAIYIFMETAKVDDNKKSSSRVLERKPKLVIEGGVLKPEDGSPVDDAIDALALQVENVMNVDETFGGVCAASNYESTELKVFDESEEVVGGFRIIYELDYQTFATERPEEHQRKVIRDAVVAALTGALPAVASDDLITADIVTNLENDQEAANRAHDIVDDLDA